jgi:hypothetical protein
VDREKRKQNKKGVVCWIKREVEAFRMQTTAAVLRLQSDLKAINTEPPDVRPPPFPVHPYPLYKHATVKHSCVSSRANSRRAK